MSNPFQTAFADYAPTLAADFVRYHTRRVERMIAEGMTVMQAYNFDKSASDFAKADGNRIGSKIVEVKTEWLQKKATEYAEFTIAQFVAKLTKKLGALTDVEVRRADGATFVITGKLGDRKVVVEQQQVFKVSAHGNPYHQWPARIYVDKKFTPEAEFKKIAA